MMGYAVFLTSTPFGPI